MIGFGCFDSTISVAASAVSIFVTHATAAVIMNVLIESSTVLSRIEDISSFVEKRAHEEDNFGCNTNDRRLTTTTMIQANNRVLNHI